MLAKAIGKQLTCVFVDHGLLRKNEREQVCEVFGEGGQFDINFVCVDARDRFYKKLADVEAPRASARSSARSSSVCSRMKQKKIGAVDFFGTGHNLPRCRGERPRRRKRHYQEPPQCRRSARLC